MDGIFDFDITLTAAFCNGKGDSYTCVCARVCLRVLRVVVGLLLLDEMKWRMLGLQCL